jgi:hypothetical protein
VAEAERQESHEAEATQDHVRHRHRRMVGQHAHFVVEGERKAESGQQEQRCQRSPPVGGYHRKAAGAPQVVGKQCSKQQQAKGRHKGRRDQHLHLYREHSEHHDRRAGHLQPEHQLNRPHGNERPPRGHGQELHGRADSRGRQNAERQEVQRRKHRARPSAEARQMLAGR